MSPFCFCETYSTLISGCRLKWQMIGKLNIILFSPIQEEACISPFVLIMAYYKRSKQASPEKKDGPQRGKLYTLMVDMHINMLIKFDIVTILARNIP